MIQRLAVSRPRRIGSALLAAGVLLVAACSDLADGVPTGLDVREGAVEGSATAALLGQELGPARAAARRHTPALMAIPGVVGTGVGLNPAGRPAVKVFLVDEQVRGIPAHLDNVPVTRLVTGLIMARPDRTARFRPASIGLSIGHPDVTAGTLGARVTDGTDVFILSNNHVIANSNNANPGDATLQPGSVDGGSEPDDVIGTLHDFQEILFGGAQNTMDAAVAIVDASDVSGQTPSDEGYGAPGTSVTAASLGLDVQKYGRTTGHTFGAVAEIDVTVDVCYAGFVRCTRSARFVGQIGISPGSFSDGGDSGSLIVTDGNGNNPVGLLFAGSSTRTIANPIGPVLARFGVSIDPRAADGGDGGDSNDPPTASFIHDCTDLTCSFDASGSSDGDGEITGYAWSFGDGNVGSGALVDHTYGGEGQYTVTLTVTDDDLATDEASQPVDVSEPGGGGGGDTAPAVVQFEVVRRTTGPWVRADVTWSVSDVDGDLAEVTSQLLDAGGAILHEASSTVSGADASGQHDLRTRGDPATVVLIVTDGNGNTTTESVGY